MAQSITAPAAATRPRIKVNKTRLNLYLDIILALLFVVEMEEHFTGLALHELLGLVFGVGFLVHILLHWGWVVSLTKKFGNKLLHESRFNYVLNWLLFIAMTTVTVTGILISRTLGLSLGLASDVSRAAETLHKLGADVVLLVVALHVAMHWKWIATYFKRYVLGSGRNKGRTPAQSRPTIIDAASDSPEEA